MNILCVDCFTNEHSSTALGLQGKDGNKSMITNGEEYDRSNNTNISTELLEIHQRYGHIIFKQLIIVAQQGIVNMKYSKYSILTCSACLCAKSTRDKWRDKKRHAHDPRVIYNYGECQLVDQLVSLISDPVAQMSRTLITTRYKYTMVY